MAPQRETREGVEKRGRLFQPVVHHASRITHHIAAGYQGEVYSVLKAEEKRGTACHPDRPAPAERQTQQEGGGKLKPIT
jgi:hypothetical protein